MSAKIKPLIRVAILDDHPIVLGGITSALREHTDMLVVHTATHGKDVVRDLTAHQVDVLLLDYVLSEEDADGIGMIARIRRGVPDIKILVYSGHDAPGTIAAVLRWGAQGFFSKAQRLDQMPDAIRTVSEGRRFLTPDVALRLFEASTDGSLQNGSTETSDSIPDGQWSLVHSARLSTREREVIRCLLDGMTITAVARKFDRSVKTISTQKSMAYRKLGIGSDNELFKIAHTLGNV